MQSFFDNGKIYKIYTKKARQNDTLFDENAEEKSTNYDPFSMQDDKVLSPQEYMNLTQKINTGSLPVEYFRKNIFNATTRKSGELKRGKVIFDNGVEKVKISRSLHQKHRDVLSILFTDNKGILEKPNSNGAYVIKTNLYYIAKEMGYNQPKDAVHLIKEFLYDLRHTEMVVTNSKTKIEDGGHRLIGEYRFDETTGDYLVNIPALTSQFKILNYAVEIPKEINRKIIAIPNSLSKIKALVSYILSNQALKNGITIENICEKLEITGSTRISEFKKQIREQEELLHSFNITLRDNIIKYEQIEEIKFYKSFKDDGLFAMLDIKDEATENIKNENDDEKRKEIELYGFEKSTFVGYYIKHIAKSVLETEEYVESQIEDIEMQVVDKVKKYRLRLGKTISTAWLTIEQLDNLKNSEFFSYKKREK